MEPRHLWSLPFLMNISGSGELSDSTSTGSTSDSSAHCLSFVKCVCI